MIIAVLTSWLFANGQQSLYGTWINTQGINIYSKAYTPDGKLFGSCYNTRSGDCSSWLLGNYNIIGDSIIQEHLFFHSNIAYQRDINHHYHMDTDSTMTTTYTDILVHGENRVVTETWVKSHSNILKDLDLTNEEEWQKACQDFPVMFGRKPAENQTIEDMGCELYDNYQRLLKANQLDSAYEVILTRAELDTTNIKWQFDALDFYLQTHSAPAMADRISNRYIRLKEQSAVNPTDTSVVNAYKLQAIIYYCRGNNGVEAMRRSISKAIDLEEASDRVPNVDLVNCYHLKAITYFPDEDFDHVYEYSKKAFDIIEKLPEFSPLIKGEILLIMCAALTLQNKNKETLENLKLCVPLFVDSVGNQLPKLTNEIYPLMFMTYGALIKENPNDEKLKKEYKQFISDKLLCADFTGIENQWGLDGTYYVMERNDWTIESPFAFTDGMEAKKYLLQKDGNLVCIDVPVGQKLNSTGKVVVVDKAWRRQILKNWKDYKKTISVR